MPTRIIYILSLLALLLILGACSTQQARMQLEVDEEVPVELGTFSFDENQMQYELFDQYRIQPGDVLDVLFQIQTWVKKPNFVVKVDHTVSVKFVHVPELNEEQRVRPDGNISLPYIGEYYVIDKTVSEIQDDLRRRYSRELQNPELYVTIPEFQESIRELKKDLHTAPRGLSRLVTVRPDGRVTFPMVGEVEVAQRTIADINTLLNDNYQHILPGLHVDLFLQKHTGALIYMVGEVVRPGAYPIHKPISVLQAMSLAEGFTPAARLDSVVVLRRDGQRMVATRTDMKSLFGFGEKQRLFYLRPDDIIVVPKMRIAQMADISGYISQALMFRGWGLSGSYELHDALPQSSEINEALGD